MPKDIVGVFMIFVVAMFFIITQVQHSSETARNQSLISAMQDSVEVTAIKSIDKSSRVERGFLDIDESIFEKNFKEIFESANSTNMETYDFKFNYLKEDEGVKAIRVTLVDDRGTEYPMTVAVDINNN